MIVNVKDGDEVGGVDDKEVSSIEDWCVVDKDSSVKDYPKVTTPCGGLQM